MSLTLSVYIYIYIYIEQSSHYHTSRFWLSQVLDKVGKWFPTLSGLVTEKWHTGMAATPSTCVTGFGELHPDG